MDVNVRKLMIVLVVLLLAALSLSSCAAPHASAAAEPEGAMIILDNGENRQADEPAKVTLKPRPTATAAPTATPTVAPTATPAPTPVIEIIEVTPAPEADGPVNKPDLIGTAEGLVCYLTFDDGPSRNTEAILEVLREKDVKATFFIVGTNADDHPERVRAIAEQGSLVANHTQTHNTDEIYDNADALLADLEAGRQTILSILGDDYPDDLMRFPYGSTNRRCRDYRDDVEAAGYRYFDWNALNGDAEHGASSRSADDLYDYLVETVDEQASRGRNLIVLMHDTNSKGKTVEMLGDAIDYIRSLGYTFDTLENKSMN